MIFFIADLNSSMALLSVSLAGKPHPLTRAANGKQTSSLKGIHVDTCCFQLSGSKPEKSKTYAINLVFSFSVEPQGVSQYAVQMLCRRKWDMDINMEGKHQLVGMDTICPLNELKASYLFSKFSAY